MSWEIVVKVNKDNPNFGEVQAKWTDPTYGPVTYSENIEANVAGVDAFIAKVISLRDAWQTRQAENESKATFVLGRLDAADPQTP